MKILLRVAREARRYARFLVIAALATLALTAVNLVAPKILTRMTGIVSSGVNEEALNTIIKLAVWLLILYLSKIAFRFFANYMAHKGAWLAVEGVRVKLYDKLQSLSMNFYHDRQTGELMSRVINDTGTFELLYAHLMPETITNIVTLSGVTVILFTMNAKLAALTCIPIPFIIASAFFFVKKVRPPFRKTQRTLAGLNAQLQDDFSGVQEIQAFGQQEYESVRVQEKASEYTGNILHALKLSAIFHPTVEFMTSLGTVIVVGFGGWLAYKNQLDVEEVVGFLLYLSLFYAPITSLANLLENAQQALAGAERVIEILDTPSDIKDSPDARPLEKCRGEVEFKNVDFSYSNGTQILKNIDFDIKPGQMAALVGPTGVGKSTTAQLICRFYDPTGGSVLVDGKDARKVTLDSLRCNIALVSQDTFLFNGTIAENIAYARPGASLDEIISASKAAYIYDDIMSMPDGFDTRVGERGTRLSGGQKQRIAIARAILRSAPILILDEATASVDVETESHIQQAIDGIAGTRTIFAIAHRLSTVRRADVILVIENGRIVQRGTHNELINKDGLYRKMWSVQTGFTDILKDE